MEDIIFLIDRMDHCKRNILLHKRRIVYVGTLICLLFTVLPTMSVADDDQPTFEEAKNFPLMGDWQGAWINPHAGHEVHHPELAAQLICLTKEQYLIRILPQLNVRAVAYLEVKVIIENNKLVINQNRWHATFADGICQGRGRLHGKDVEFTLKKVVRLSETIGLKPPKGATVLFDGHHIDQWHHHDGRKVTWSLLENGVMQTVSSFWNDNQNRENGLGGDIVTKEKFGSMQFHMEFRYAIEPGKHGQQRGNSGLFFHGIGEVQILNNYGTLGFWNECGAFYKMMPPKVNAAGPPLQWQTYDVEIELPSKAEQNQNALVTVYLNGHKIHNKTALPYHSKNGVSIGLQDHINALQYRNIWVKYESIDNY